VKPKIRVVPIAELILDERNANKGTKRGLALLEESLGKYGAGRSVVVDRNHRVIAGNKTVEAAVAAGMKSIAVIETDGSSLVAVQRGDLDLERDKKARGLAIADNRVGEIDLEWNPEVLASLDVDLTQFWNENELNALLKGFRSNEFSAPEPKLDQAAELQKKWNTKLQQIWEIGNPRPRTDKPRVIFGDWTERPDGFLYRLVHAPRVWLKLGEAIPSCADCGTPFRKTKEYPGMVGYAADCVDKHDPDRMTHGM
jgi:hypothetical protein